MDTQFVRFFREIVPYLLSLNNIKTDRKELKMQTKRRVLLNPLLSLEVMMKPFNTTRGPADVKEFVPGPRPVTSFKEVTEMQPTFTLTFSIGTAMRDIHDAVIRTVLQYTRSNRLRAAQLLQINPRTIRRRLGKKEGASSAVRAA